MDPTSLGFVTLMVILAGVLCYAGDLLGRKLGKKRLTILGLRPRHTAALFTALFGGVATLIIILILGAASADVRTWIIEGNRARAELQKTQKEYSDLKNLNEGLVSENRTLSTERTNTAKELANQKALLARADADVKRLTSNTQKLAREAASFQRQISEARKEVGRVRAEYAKVNNNLTDVKVNRDQLIKTNSELSGQNLRLVNQNAALDKTLGDLNAQVEKLRADREKADEDLKAAQEAFKTEIDAKTTTLNRISEELAEAEKSLTAIKTDLAEKQKQLEDIGFRLSTAQSDLRLASLRVNRGDELARVPLGAHLNLAESRRALVLAVSLSSDEAKRRGAALVPGTDDYATFIDLPTDPVIRGEEQMAKALSEMIDQDRPKLLIMRSLFNTFENEFVPVKVEIVDNPVIYAKDQLVDQFDVDGSKTEQEIAGIIAERAATTIWDKAVRAGLIPSNGRPQPIGELNRETVINLVQSIKGANRRVQVRLYAMEETRAGDVLRLTYKIR